MPDAQSDDHPTEVDPAAFARLVEEVTRLRLQIADSIRTRQVVIVDEAGVARARLAVTSDGGCRFVLLDEDGFERIGLTATHDAGTIDLASHTPSEHGEPRVRLFALDPADGADFAVGVHLAMHGNAVAGFEILEGQPTRVWTS